MRDLRTYLKDGRPSSSSSSTRSRDEVVVKLKLSPAQATCLKAPPPTTLMVPEVTMKIPLYFLSGAMSFEPAGNFRTRILALGPVPRPRAKFPGFRTPLRIGPRPALGPRSHKGQIFPFRGGGIKMSLVPSAKEEKEFSNLWNGGKGSSHLRHGKGEKINPPKAFYAEQKLIGVYL